ncbi:MAG: sigma 54-interacting transcriptional regulator, partial [Kofleriaceae bacterium]
VHARIVRTGAVYVLEDAGSTNGTLVNGAPTARHVLRDEDVVELGQTLFLYREIAEDSVGPAPDLDSSAPTGLPPAFATLDPALERRLQRLVRVAPSSLSILLLGETGTGKELLARGLHALSQRPGPFVAVNCGAIPDSLIESHLFGHVRGAFSGALRDEPGVVRSAQHGTLLLDEIGDLPATSQAALLRVLQESEVRAVGSAHTMKVDVRVIAATHMPLEALIDRGTFRRDLYARLAGYSFTIPPLRDRRVDLGVLVAGLLAAGKLGASPDLRIHNDAARLLVRHVWPMNVRELEQGLRAAALLAEDATITAHDLPPAISAALDEGPTATPKVECTFEQTVVLPAGPAHQRALIVGLIVEHQGNLSAVARVLQTSRSQLHRLLERHGIELRPP